MSVERGTRFVGLLVLAVLAAVSGAASGFVLDRLKELGIKLALITNGAAEPQRAKVVRFALEHRFDHIQIEGKHGFGKPEERAYKHALEVLGVGSQETWMVGDNLEWEIVAPQRLGIYGIWHDGHGVGLPVDPPPP
jgi:putative hydrolase of the HAD superfamily